MLELERADAFGVYSRAHPLDVDCAAIPTELFESVEFLQDVRGGDGSSFRCRESLWE